MPSAIIEETLQPYIDRQALAGAVTLVGNRDRVLALDCLGYADLARRMPMSEDAFFWIASQTKPITVALMMMLVDEGKIRLNDPVAGYLPEFKDQWLAVESDDQHVLLKKPSRPITLRHILSNTSGLVFASPVEKPTFDLLSLRIAARVYAATHLQSEPGTKYAYSNAGFNTAGAMLEIVSGRSFGEFLQERLLEPLGMVDTTFWPSDSQLKRLAKTYLPNAAKTALEESPIAQLQAPLGSRLRHPLPAGGLFSTAQDLLRFCRLLLNGGTFNGQRLLSEAAVQEMTSRQTPETAEAYGLGFQLGKTTFGHGGAYGTRLWIDRERNLISIFLIQHAGYLHDGSEANLAFKHAAEQLPV